MGRGPKQTTIDKCQRLGWRENTWWSSEEGKGVCPGTVKDDIHHPILLSRRRAGVRPER